MFLPVLWLFLLFNEVWRCLNHITACFFYQQKDGEADVASVGISLNSNIRQPMRG